jgi:hypothetical protein
MWHGLCFFHFGSLSIALDATGGRQHLLLPENRAKLT